MHEFDSKTDAKIVTASRENSSGSPPTARVLLLKVSFSPEKFTTGDIPRFRAYLARQFPEFAEIHNHLDDGKFRYVYPELQFKFLNQEPAIIAHGSGLEILIRIFQNVEEMEINQQTTGIVSRSISMLEGEIGISPKMVNYRFLTPWMALNQENFIEYQKLAPAEREQKLNRILWGNLKTVAHAFDYWIPDPEQIQVYTNLKMEPKPFKGNTMITFSGEFMVNFHLPNFLGLGKQVARGFGTIKRIGGES
ncbi:hypothetical protein JXJ21_11090 [candidate division KSB1 bacterium]|nr:hypothetical protein [candidate division KSB1 bacterium]